MQVGQVDEESPGNRQLGIQDWLRGRGQKRHVGHPPLSLKVGAKGDLEPRAAVVCGVQSTHGVLVPIKIGRAHV